ncbi:hypothetical protein PGT21_013108 [Puccinia graminis f. sp. tritici]|uniref:Uncharacterized protein n=1 Tax=Puccinia graminis f. sp. tritici TaxID=56615 RepID=A0A5B0QFR5_PUCGR|nr:hypothetical protein PGT21_013108 [Puccinia graminis f. sp. tritici]
MSLKSGNTSFAFVASNPQATFRKVLPLSLTSALILYLHLTSHRPTIPHETAGGVAEPVKQSHNGTDGLDRVETTDLPQTGVEDLIQVGINDLNNTYTPEELMSLPILHQTLMDPFDPLNGLKPLRDSKSPCQSTSQNGALLIKQLSRNRFPPPDSIDSSRGSSPPPIPTWPPRTLLRDKEESLKTPIPKHKIAGLNASYVWEGKEKIQEGKLPKIQWLGFDKPDWETPTDRINRLERQAWVRRGFQHVWEGYKAKAWGHDELKPISGLVSVGLIGKHLFETTV